jgi:hypothetical protein
VILAFTTYNDVYDNSRTLSKTEEVPYFSYRNGELVEDVSFRESKTYRQRDSQINRLGRWFHNRYARATDSLSSVRRQAAAD